MTGPEPAVPPQAITAALGEADRLRYERISTKSVTAMLEAARPHLAAASPEAVTRFEVIDQTGRVLVRYGIVAQLSYQDDDRTLKVFLRDREYP